MTRPATPALLAVLLLALAGCGGSTFLGSDTADGRSGSDARTDPMGAWVLDVARSDITFPPGTSAAMLVREDGTVSGTSPCNGWGGQVATTADGSWSLRQFSTETAGCEAPWQQAQGALYSALQAATSWEVTGDGTLVLTDGSAVLVFAADAPAPTEALLDTDWQVVKIEMDGRSRPVPDGVPTPTFRFTGEPSGGAFTQHTGCRRASGDWVRRGGRVDRTAWMQVDDVDVFEDCSEDQVATEEAVETAVSGGFRLEVEGEQLVLRSTRSTSSAVVLRAGGGS